MTAVGALVILAINLFMLWQMRRYTRLNSARTDLTMESVMLLEKRVFELERSARERR